MALLNFGVTLKKVKKIPSQCVNFFLFLFFFLFFFVKTYGVRQVYAG